jgi:hypothetical protein
MTTSRLRNGTIALAAATVTAQSLGGELDWHYDGGLQTRRVVITSATAGDSFLIEGTLNGTDWFTANTALTGSTSYVVTLTGPYFALRITKTGTAGSATIQYMV